ncbi:MAG: isocitrate dehydrogenase kinase/phosphatase-domain containing protein [Rhodocyclaceae bacterium]
MRAAFMKHHADLLDVGFWQRAQEDIRSGKIRDFFPYPEAQRFCHRFAERKGNA